MVPTASTDKPRFIYVICQRGAEKTLREEVLSNHDTFRLAFSRPGFVTFKVEADSLGENFSLKSTLARTWGWSLGKVAGDSAKELVTQITADPQYAKCSHVHVWERDHTLPGKNGFEPGISPLATEAAAQLAEVNDAITPPTTRYFNRVASVDDHVFDVVMVEPNEWWYGYHIASHVAGRWPGGVPIVDTKVETVSRAYFKLKEALLWSGITIHPGDVCAEIGSAPGGACQLLLEMGATVIGIDPAEMEDEILKHDQFTHVRKRSSEVRKKDFSQVKWLVSDMSVTPTYTLDAIEEIVSHDRVSVTGVIMTMKLTDWKLVNDVPALMKRAGALGFKFVRSRQLAFNRREFCMVAVKDRYALRKSRKIKRSERVSPKVQETTATLEPQPQPEIPPQAEVQSPPKS